MGLTRALKTRVGIEFEKERFDEPGAVPMVVRSFGGYGTVERRHPQNEVTAD